MSMRIKLTLLSLAAMALAACSGSDITVNIDILSFIDPADVSYQSGTFDAPQNLPLNVDLPAGTNPVFSTQSPPTTVNLLEGGSDLIEFNSVTLEYKMEVEPQNFSGLCTVKLYLGTMPDVFNDPTGLVISDQHVLPATFDLSSSDPLLNFLFEQNEIFVGYEVILEPLRLTDHQVSASGQIKTFETVLVGRQGII